MLEKILSVVYPVFVHFLSVCSMRSLKMFATIVLFGAVLSACTSRDQQSVSAKPEVPAVQTQEVMVKKEPVQNVTSSKSPSRVVRVTTENWKFTPNVIRVKKGENITLSLQGLSGLHGFAVQDLGINVPVAQGKTVDVKLPTDKSGSFGFRCSIPCGLGHADMRGTIVIEE